LYAEPLARRKNELHGAEISDLLATRSHDRI
jgi:hypothetical protein